MFLLDDGTATIAIANKFQKEGNLTKQFFFILEERISQDLNIVW